MNKNHNDEYHVCYYIYLLFIIQGRIRIPFTLFIRAQQIATTNHHSIHCNTKRDYTAIVNPSYPSWMDYSIQLKQNRCILTVCIGCLPGNAI